MNHCDWLIYSFICVINWLRYDFNMRIGRKEKEKRKSNRWPHPTPMQLAVDHMFRINRPDKRWFNKYFCYVCNEMNWCCRMWNVWIVCMHVWRYLVRFLFSKFSAKKQIFRSSIVTILVVANFKCISLLEWRSFHMHKNLKC